MLGLELPVAREHRLAPLTLALAPNGVDEKRVRATLLERYGMEIGGGLGAFAGKAWRFGLMGASSTRRHVMLCLAALDEALRDQGYVPPGDPIRAASATYDPG
jgi:alanine-glyoxylate transaminase/serine-glyoxylate transaminase/serine-pyruvate transaminase